MAFFSYGVFHKTDFCMSDKGHEISLVADSALSHILNLIRYGHFDFRNLKSVLAEDLLHILDLYKVGICSYDSLENIIKDEGAGIFSKTYELTNTLQYPEGSIYFLFSITPDSIKLLSLRFRHTISFTKKSEEILLVFSSDAYESSQAIEKIEIKQGKKAINIGYLDMIDITYDIYAIETSLSM